VAGAGALRGEEALTEPFFSADDLSFRPFADEDVSRMAAWLRDPEVGAWWHGVTETYDDAFVRGHVLEDAGTVTHAIVELDGVPIGFQQWYDARRDAEAREAFRLDGHDEVWGIDQLIGESRLHGQGIGTRQVRAVGDWLLGPDGPGAERLITDPVVENLRAVHCYERAGFRVVRRLPNHETLDGQPRDSWLMERRAS
jgi:aminoglycoside 6'-N-acetyltransferase